MTPLLLIGLAAGSAAILVLAAWLMLRVSDSDRQFAARMSAARGIWTQREPGTVARRRTVLGPVQGMLAAIGQAVMRSGLLPGRTRGELQQSLAASGFRGPNALALFLGAKLVLIGAGPLVGWLAVNALDLDSTKAMATVGGGFIIGLVAPDWSVRRTRKAYLSKLEEGVADALDLLVICTQAGLNLEAAMGRVAAELAKARPEIALELSQTVRELEIMADSQAALNNLGKRTGLETLRRLVATLVQTMQYGTPLSDALRTLSAEVRQQALNRFEARAARLPVLLTLPMILFILPCVFIIVGGPAVIQVSRTFGH